MSVYDQVKQALQDVVVPEIKALQIEIKRLDEKIDNRFASLDEKIDTRFISLDGKIDSLRREMTAEIKRLDDKVDNLDEKIDTAIQIRERLAALEAKLTSL